METVAFTCPPVALYAETAASVFNELADPMQASAVPCVTGSATLIVLLGALVRPARAVPQESWPLIDAALQMKPADVQRERVERHVVDLLHRKGWLRPVSDEADG